MRWNGIGIRASCDREAYEIVAITLFEGASAASVAIMRMEGARRMLFGRLAIAVAKNHGGTPGKRMAENNRLIRPQQR